MAGPLTTNRSAGPIGKRIQAPGGSFSTGGFVAKLDLSAPNGFDRGYGCTGGCSGGRTEFSRRDNS